LIISKSLLTEINPIPIREAKTSTGIDYNYRIELINNKFLKIYYLSMHGYAYKE